MSNQAEIECWNITDCERADGCAVKEYDGMACWEVARIREDYQNILKVCEDCLVYITVSANKNTSLSEDEINNIWKQKGKCVLIPKCEKCEEEAA
jgi:hypothetical protein